MQEDPLGRARTREWVEQVDAALRLAVRRRLVADVPVGVLLSGGLDSSLITAMIAEEVQATLHLQHRIRVDRRRRGRRVPVVRCRGAKYATDHHRWTVPTGDVLDVLPAVIGAMSEPMVSHDVVAFYLLSEQVARDIKVVQSGQGADEVFAGYHWYAKMARRGR